MTNLAAVLPQVITALIAVESRGVVNARGADGELGCLQIRAECVADVNRVYGTHYVHEDALAPGKAILICKLYLLHWAPQAQRSLRFQARTALKPMTNEELLARTWNGGPDGWHREATDAYWKRVKEELRYRRALDAVAKLETGGRS
jgi:hypothetical protein